MLGFLRKKKNNPIIVGVLGLVILLMILFGISLDPGGGRGWAAKVAGSEIKSTDFNAQYANAYRGRQSQDRSYDRTKAEQERLRERVLFGMINRRVMAERARRTGLAVDDDALVQVLMETPAFQIEGRFNHQQYERVLNSMQLSKEQYEALRREDMLSMQYLAVLDNISIPEVELKKTYAWENLRVDVEFAAVEKAAFTDQVGEPTEADLSEFRAREDAEEGIMAYYRREKSKKYDVPRKACAAHILVRTDSSMKPAGLAEKRKKLEAASEAIRGGMAFAEAARKFSEDANKGRGGDLGCFAPGETVEQLAQAAFGLEPGEISPIVDTPFGLHLVKLNRIEEAIKKKLEDVRPEIERELARLEKASRRAREKAAALIEAAATAGTLAKAGASLNTKKSAYTFRVEETGPFPAGREFLPKLGKAKAVSKAAFALTTDAPLGPAPIETETSWVVLRLKARHEPDDESFEQQRKMLLYTESARKAETVLQDWGRDMRERNNVLVDPLAVRYDDEAEALRQQRRRF